MFYYYYFSDRTKEFNTNSNSPPLFPASISTPQSQSLSTVSWVLIPVYFHECRRENEFTATGRSVRVPELKTLAFSFLQSEGS